MTVLSYLTNKVSHLPMHDSSEASSRALERTIRLVLHWNAQNGAILEATQIIELLTEADYSDCADLKGFFFKAFHFLSSEIPLAHSERILSTLNRANSFIKRAKMHETHGELEKAEVAIKDLFND